jgi:hypothetical protein
VRRSRPLSRALSEVIPYPIPCGDWFTTQNHEPPSLTMLPEPSTSHAMWLPELQRKVDLGIVYGQSNENRMYWMYEYLKKRGSK